MSEKKEKKKIRLVQTASFWSTWAIALFIASIGSDCMYYYNQLSTKYEARKSIDDISMDELQEDMYVEGVVTSTVCCYASCDLYDYYVINIGEEGGQCITVLSKTYDSIALEKLPTSDYRWQDGTEQEKESEEGYYICGRIKLIDTENINYSYLKTQFGVDSEREVDKLLSNKYCIKIVDPDNIEVWGNAGKASFACAGMIVLFVVIPSYRKRTYIKHVEEDELEKRKMARKKTSASIKHFLEQAYEEVSLIILEHNGEIAKITVQTEIKDVLNCFIQANYDKVYDEYVEEEEEYHIEFVMKNGDSITSAMNTGNIIFWYGGMSRIDHNSCKKIKNIIRSTGI